MDEVKNSSSDSYMYQALELAKKGLGSVHPNPPVGCVIVSPDGVVLSEGYHEYFGGPHAEANAINNLKNKKLLRGSTFYVTLEPCAHRAKTGSCAQLMATLPIAKVIYALKDPNPLVDGAGIQILKNAGIAVEQFQSSNSELAEQIESLAEIFFKNMKTKRTFISLKIATSLDAKMALSSGESHWITNQESRFYVQELRAQHKAVLIGARTLLADNPHLNIRRRGLAAKTNKVIVFDPRASALQKITGNENIFKCRNVSDIIWLIDEKHMSVKASLTVERVKLHWTTLAEDLFAKEIESVFVEGGAYTASEFIKNNCIDRLHLFMAPFLAGDSNYGWTDSVQLKSMKDRMDFVGLQTKKFNNDIYLSMRYAAPSRRRVKS